MSPLTFIGNWAAKSRFWPLSNTKKIAFFMNCKYHMFCESRSTACSCGPSDRLSSAFVRPFGLHLCLRGPATFKMYSQRPDKTDDMWPKVRIKRPHSSWRALQHNKGVKVWAEVTPSIWGLYIESLAYELLDLSSIGLQHKATTPHLYWEWAKNVHRHSQMRHVPMKL